MVRKKETHLIVHSSPREDKLKLVFPSIFTSRLAGKCSPDVSGGPGVSGTSQACMEGVVYLRGE